MEDVAVMRTFRDGYRSKRALVTGHTGFKGAWLASWLHTLGCEVMGFALPPETSPSLSEDPAFAEAIRSVLGDVRDRPALLELVRAFKPDYVFHLAAQSLVRASYETPAETFDTNVGGTVNVLEAVRRAGLPCSVIVVTTDKVYENREWLYAYRECDALGGRDPYSASKAAAEIATAAYVSSFFGASDVAVSTVRAGNVVGGGDYAVDRILPDAVRAFRDGIPLVLRNPVSTRPWQYVLEPLAGYLQLAVAQRTDRALAGAWNFGPDVGNERPVREVARLAASCWPGAEIVEGVVTNAVHESTRLKIDCTKARTLLGFQPLFGIEETIGRSIAWYRDNPTSASTFAPMCDEIRAYTARASASNLEWTRT